MRDSRSTRTRPSLRLPVFLLLLVAVIATEAGNEFGSGIERQAPESDRQGPYVLRIAQAAGRLAMHVRHGAGAR